MSHYLSEVRKLGCWVCVRTPNTPIFGYFFECDIVILVPTLAVTVRRLHDVGKSGWWILISLIPIIGGIWLLILTVTVFAAPAFNPYLQPCKGVLPGLQSIFNVLRRKYCIIVRMQGTDNLDLIIAKGENNHQTIKDRSSIN